MTNLKLPTLGLSLILLITACSKNDMQETSASDVALATTATVADTVGWKSANVWETADQETFSVRYFTINDAAITADVADNGLVLLFKRSGTTVNALPFEEGTASTENTSANYWYHQVSEGSLLVSCDVYNGATTDAATAFKYFVITPEKLQSLEADGYTTETLLNLSYSDAAALINKAS